MSNQIPTLRVEIAKTLEQQERGLMWRKRLPENSGMLFDFAEAKNLAFWMKNTYIPLQIAFINREGKIIQIERMSPQSTKRVFSRIPCRYALEANDKWFDKNGIKVGSYVENINVEWLKTKMSKPEKMILSQITEDSFAKESPKEDDSSGSVALPSMKILSSWKDIFKKADELEVPLLIEWETKNGFRMPVTQISPPYELGETADGEKEGLLIAWSDRTGGFISPIIENIVGVFSKTGMPINREEDLVS